MIRVLQGDCRSILPTLPANSVHTVVTSPPYYGLRDYGVAGQLGLEATPDEYIQTMVAVFREVRRVLRDDGTCWVNMGDSYCAPGGGYKPDAPSNLAGSKQSTQPHAIASLRGNISYGAKPKDLLMMPARLALALQQDGWWLRSDIIWSKPNPMPESVTDRPTRSHEYVFLLTKSARYYYDQQGIAEPLDRPEEAERETPARFGGALKFAEASKQSRLHTGNEYRGTPNGTRNARSVWTIATHAYPDAHFATFPPELAERCIKAGTSERGCCAQCGTPWVRVTERTAYGDKSGGDRSLERGYTRNALGGQKEWDAYIAPATTGWAPACQCAPIAHTSGFSYWTKPCTVLDPFAGAGTTGLVADRLQRDAVLIELLPAYCAMLRNRITQDAPLLAEVAD